MRPVHEFKANFSQLVKPESMTDTGLPNVAADVSLHEADSSARNVCFVWEDGRKAFFNYAYLVTVDLTVQDGLNVLLLSFGAHTVIVKGHGLGSLFDLLMEHAPKIIMVVNPRYITRSDSHDAVVVEILVKSD